MPCSTCYQATVKSCPSEIKLVAGLSGNTLYFWVITTKSKVYQRLVSTDADGSLTIDCSAFPDGTLNAHSGSYKLEIRSGSNYLLPIPLVFGEDVYSYSCVQFSFVNTDGEGANNYIYSPAPDAAIDQSHLEITFNVIGAMHVQVIIEKTNDADASQSQWGDSMLTDYAASDSFTAETTLNDGVYVLKIYPIAGVTNPQAQAVTIIKSITILRTVEYSGQVFVSFGKVLSKCLNLRELQVIGFGMPDLPTLPIAPPGSPVRSVNVRHNMLGSYAISKLFHSCDKAGWPVGDLDVKYNPGASLLTAEGLAAKQSLITKGWNIIV